MVLKSLHFSYIHASELWFSTFEYKKKQLILVHFKDLHTAGQKFLMSIINTLAYFKSTIKKTLCYKSYDIGL